jgi:hypothetical protein
MLINGSNGTILLSLVLYDMRLYRFWILLVLLLSTASLTPVKAQDNYVYIQHEDKTPFFVVLQGKKYRSNATGYLLISKIANTNNELLLGFGNDQNPSYAFNYHPQGKDGGLTLKKNAAGDYGLYNIKPNKPKTNNTTDAFGQMLASVVDDSTLTVNDAMASTTPTSSTKIPTQASINSADTTPTPTTIDDTTISITRSIVKAKEVEDSTSTTVTFLESYGDVTDTIVISIEKSTDINEALNKRVASSAITRNEPSQPSVKDTVITNLTVNEKSSTSSTVIATKVPTDSTSPTIPKGVAGNPYFQPAPDTVATSEKSNSSTPTVTRPASGATCKISASNDDFVKLRKRIVSNGVENKMVAIAQKAFIEKCYTVDQMKQLGIMFLTDDGRYKFFEMAFAYTIDVVGFATLETQLIQSTNKEKFMQLIRSAKP